MQSSARVTPDDWSKRLMAFPTLPSRPLPQFLTAHPSFSATPSPHFRLPEPCSDYCLTLYALYDRKDIKRIIQDPNHETFRSGGSGMTDAASDEDCDRYEKMFGNNEGSWPFVGELGPYVWCTLSRSPVIRQISRIAEWSPSDPGSKPPALGLLFFDLNGFRDTAWSDEERKRRRALNAELPDSERHWMGGLFLDTSHRGQGLMTVRTLILLALVWPSRANGVMPRSLTSLH